MSKTAPDLAMPGDGAAWTPAPGLEGDVWPDAGGEPGNPAGPPALSHRDDGDDGRRGRRRRRLVYAVVTFVIVLGVAAAAVYFSRAGVTGSGKAGASFNASFASAQPVTTTGSTAQSCAASINGSGQLVLDVGGTAGVYPGEQCNYTATVTTDQSNPNATISGLDMPGLPAGWRAVLSTGCGERIDSTWPMRQVTISVLNDTDGTGGSYNIGSASNPAGVKVTQGSPAVSCPVTVNGQ